MTRRRVFATLCVWLALSLSLWLTDAQPAVFALGGVIVAAAAAVVTSVDMAKRIRRVEWLSGGHRPTTAVADARVVALRRQIDAARWSGSTELHDTLVVLTDDRLSTQHGIERPRTPAAAEAALSPTLRRLVSTGGGTVSARDLRRILTDLEAL